MNLKKALPTITVILAVIAPGFLAVSAAIDNVSLNARVLDAVRKAWNAFYHNLASLHSRFLTIILDVISLRDTAFLAASREEFKRARRKK